MQIDFKHTWVNWMHLLVIGPLLLVVGLKGKQAPQAVFSLMLVLGLGVITYHLYRLVMTYKKEGFLRANNYYWMHNPEGKEPFVPFSHPYTCESSAYYSYHDPNNSRACSCDLNGGEGACAQQNLPQDATDMVSSKPSTASGVASAAPVKPATGSNPAVYSDYGMRTVAPVMGRNPAPGDYLL